MKLERAFDYDEQLAEAKQKYANEVVELKAQGKAVIFATVVQKEWEGRKFYSVFYKNKEGENVGLQFKGLKLPKGTANGLYIVSYPKDAQWEKVSKEKDGKVYITIKISADLDDVDFEKCNMENGLTPVEDDGLPF